MSNLKKDRWITSYYSVSDFEKIEAIVEQLHTDRSTFSANAVLKEIGAIEASDIQRLRATVSETRIQMSRLEMENTRLKARSWWQRLLRKGE